MNLRSVTENNENHIGLRRTVGSNNNTDTIPLTEVIISSGITKYHFGFLFQDYGKVQSILC